MKKQLLLSIVLIGIVLGIGFPSIEAYSPHYLPGGKNYLSIDNFQYANGILFTTDAFLVKPYTDYALTIPRDYSENGDGSEITLQFWEGEEPFEVLLLDASGDFQQVSGADYYFMTFQTGASINYMSMRFEDGRDPLSLQSVLNMQLEEGTLSTAATSIEAYIPGTMTDVNGPYFEGNPIVISNVSDPLTLAEIQSGLTAVDGVSGDVTEDIEIISDAYTGNGGILGNYAIVFQVADAVGNTTSFTVTVIVVDVTDPVITGPATVTVPFPQVKTVAQLMTLLSASDNYDGDLSEDLVAVSDGYSAFSSVVGNYDVVFEVTDSSGNQSSFTLCVSVVDTEAPVFSGISEVTLGYDQTMTVTEIQSGLSALDGYDGDLTSGIMLFSDGYSSHLHEVGQYLVVFQVSDANDNTTQKTVIVRIVDEIGPIVYFDTSIIRVYNSTILTLEDFTTLLLRAEELEEGQRYTTTVRFDSYTSHATTPGSYHLTLDFQTSSGDVLTKTFQIIVKENDHIGNLPDLFPDESSYFEKNMSWIVGTSLGAMVGIANLVFLLVRKNRIG